MTQEDAEILALSALSFLGRNDKLLRRFIDLTGIDLTAISAQAEQPDFLAAVLDFLTRNEPDLLAFVDDAPYRPEDVRRAQTLLEQAGYGAMSDAEHKQGPNDSEDL